MTVQTITTPTVGSIVSITDRFTPYGGIVTNVTDTVITIRTSRGKTVDIVRAEIEAGYMFDENGDVAAEFGPTTPGDEPEYDEFALDIVLTDEEIAARAASLAARPNYQADAEAQDSAVTVADPDNLMGSPAYDGPASEAHTVLAAGHYLTTDGRAIVVNGEHSMIAGASLLDLDSGIYFLLDPANPDNTWRNLGVTPGAGQWDQWGEIEWAGVGDDEEELLAAIALAVRTGAPEDIAAARAADDAYAAIPAG